MNFLHELYNIKILHIMIVGIVIWIAVVAMNRVIHKFFQKTDFLEERKEQTIESLFRSLTRYIGTIGFILFVISQYVDHFGKIVAGAGVIGIIIGFGAQSLIKDVLAGLLFLYEKQLHKGDYVTINNTYSGVVTETGIRALRIREWNGKLLTISNGEIKQIENYNIEFMRIDEKVITSFRENPSRVWEVLEETCRTLNTELQPFLKKDQQGNYVELFHVFGMTSLNQGFRGYEYTITALAEHSTYFQTARAARRIIAQSLYDANIQLAEDTLFIHNEANAQNSKSMNENV